MELQCPISLVVFDYGNVLARVDHARFFARLTGAPVGVARELVRRFYGQHSIGADYESGTLTFDQFHERLAEGIAEFSRGHSLGSVDQLRLGPWEKPAFLSAFCDMFDNLEETWQFLRELKPYYRIGLLSNTNAVHFEHVISKIPVFELFDQITMSWQVGCMKPDRRIFEDVVRKFGGSPTEILYLDDIARYVEAARQSGFQALVFDPERRNELLASLRRQLLPRP
ncbi:MAG TPA: HAD-IA family hydrolase [Candidatus Ozemobacteraceae bacterium]|nr:HAD-IA family hydrolase [Candidatus Ozemobacteraceae bacterium]